MNPKHLILTALEETWPSEDIPVVFLGEWCKIYDRKEKWSKYNGETFPYHWDDRAKLYRDYLYIQDLYEDVLSNLSEKLNEIHNVNHSLRYWRILIGPWLGYFMQMVFDRFEMLRILIERNIELYCKIDESLVKILVPNDMEDFGKKYLGDDWNFAIYSYLLQNMKSDNIYKQKINLKTESLKIRKISIKTQLSKVGKGILLSILNFWPSSNGPLIISSYLPILSLLRIQIELGEVPKIWKRIQCSSYRLNHQQRNWTLNLEFKSEFEVLLSKLIPIQMPTGYLEGYLELCRSVSRGPWPENPRFIFTSNEHNSSDYFKAYVGEKTERNVKYFLGQHGGHYGIGKWSFMEDHEIESSDRYLTWGWKDISKPNAISFASIKIIGINDYKFVKDGKLLLVTMSIPRYSYWMYSIPVGSQWMNYFNDQVRFVRSLDTGIQVNDLVVRLPSSDFNWNQNLRWRDIFPYIRLDYGNTKIEKLIQNSRIYVSTYNATTFLESMGRNTPTIIFWNPNHWEIRDTAVPFFEILKNVGIFHESPEEAAKMVNKIWNHVPEWWYSKEVQDAKNEFCYEYVRKVKNPLTILNNYLKT
ncbi:LIC12162 family transferase [Leptospira vanthielii]|uniref:Transferase, TIGR04331 family n=1 Tax=Leptospira vanthielii serovar Holland str. Waz Holland = ATCC 700522 TaxID=1218591 RepID=N1VZM2_9LEPT|nr:LIC12162 family protein [Leptospira vanthielii]EMY69419.1 transferase, TIGR04331 family [Leptospira vanthielii serovar Holland str. Waz Holland = ATCC 700522]